MDGPKQDDEAPAPLRPFLPIPLPHKHTQYHHTPKTPTTQAYLQRLKEREERKLLAAAAHPLPHSGVATSSNANTNNGGSHVAPSHSSNPGLSCSNSSAAAGGGGRGGAGAAGVAGAGPISSVPSCPASPGGPMALAEVGRSRSNPVLMYVRATWAWHLRLLP